MPIFMYTYDLQRYLRALVFTLFVVGLVRRSNVAAVAAASSKFGSYRCFLQLKIHFCFFLLLHKCLYKQSTAHSCLFSLMHIIKSITSEIRSLLGRSNHRYLLFGIEVRIPVPISFLFWHFCSIRNADRTMKNE